MTGRLEMTAFRRLGKVAWQGLTKENGKAVSAARRPRSCCVYRRYGHWWDKGFPDVEEGDGQGLNAPASPALCPGALELAL